MRDEEIMMPELIARIWTLNELLWDDAGPMQIADCMEEISATALEVGGAGVGAAQAVYDGWRLFDDFAHSKGIEVNDLLEPVVAMVASRHYEGDA